MGRWVGSAVVIAVCSAFLLKAFGTIGSHEITQSFVISILVACLGLVAFYAGDSRSGDWQKGVSEKGWLALSRFWLWPCLTFALTYYLVQAGFFAFLIQIERVQDLAQVVMAGTTAALMTGYCFYLGRCKLLESETQQGIPENIKSCPFVMGILSKTGIMSKDHSPTSVVGSPTQPEKVG